MTTQTVVIPTLYTATGSPGRRVMAETIQTRQQQNPGELVIVNEPVPQEAEEEIICSISPTRRAVSPQRASPRRVSPGRTAIVRTSPGRPVARASRKRVVVEEEVPIQTAEEEEEEEEVIEAAEAVSNALKQSQITAEMKENIITDINVPEEKLLYPEESTIVITSQTKEIRQNGMVNILQQLMVQQGYGLRVFSTETPMLPQQDRKYELELKAQIDFRGNKTSDGIFVPITNFLYPKNIFDPTLPPDALLVEGGWIDRASVTGQLGSYSPKLNFIYNFVNQRRNRRHVIYTKYESRYGLDLVIAVLRSSGYQPLALTYNYRDPAGRSRGRTSRQHLESIRKFNTDPRFNIIVADINALDAGLLDVDYIHFFDIPTFTIFASYINKIYHLQYYRLQKPLTIVFHIAERANNTKSLEHEQLERLYIEMVEKTNLGIKLL